ncbi:competence-related pilin export protein ComGB [Virgibacillus subterraneus]|uniref:Competence-related pilin export protein ComGB n=2 Tax=Virgibacillus TaxID=84406 RepID=A0A1H1BFA5_9BACI|nr:MULTISPECIES: type II secretion system F family protein [Virgibacillus]SDQ50577.1 competence-related pilin export protein ComGB [Virgibacillus salinus]SEQ19590.1 competence-related pilin export protein ComGB [Virgibacillus subterraneus]
MVLSLKKLITQLGNKSPKKEIQLRFLKRVERLLTNGYPLISALEIIDWDNQLKSISTSVITSLKAGNSLDQALEKENFNPLITSYLYFVRANGDLQANIEKCISMYEQRVLYVKKFQETIRYPLILLFVFALLLYFVKQSVLPSFMDLFNNNTGTASTVMFSIVLIELLGRLLTIMILITVLSLVLWQVIKHKVSIENQIKFYRLIPIYHQYKRMQTSFLFATHVSSLLKTGMSIKQILFNLSQQRKQPILSYFALLMTEELSNGVYITNLLANLPLLDKQLSTIFQKNADVNALEKDLTIYAELQTEEIHRKVMKVITYMQPVFFIILASFIIFIYVTLMWPMFQLIKTI